MKKILYTLLAGVVALASCSKEAAEELAPQTESTTFTLSVDQPETPAQAKAATRATSIVSPTRYVMEVWSEDGTQPENVFGTGDAATNHAELMASSGSSFTVNLDKTKAYTCLFWADDNETFDATLLKSISQNSGKMMNDIAYHAKVAVPKGKNPAVSVTLKRAVAKITFTETSSVRTEDDFTLKFSAIYRAFSVLDGGATGETSSIERTVKPAATTGVIGTCYFFAKTTPELFEFKFKYASEDEKTVSNVPYQQNYATNIKGEYSNLFNGTFTVTADDEWETPDNGVDFGTKVYKVGDVYPDATAPIGVVFWVDESDASYNSTAKTSAKGKIVSLNESTGRWGFYGMNESSVVTDIDSDDDGATATKNLITARKDDSGFATDYYAFNWIYATKNGNNVDGRWYLPAKNELLALYAAWNGSSSTTADNAARDAFDGYLTAANGTVITGGYYWSTTEDLTETAWAVFFGDGRPSNYFKDDYNVKVRAVSAF